jgi:DNA invertase Pin-like site-specific DNA recombinase
MAETTIGDLFETVRRMRREGRGGPIPRADVEAVGTLFASVREIDKGILFSLDEQRGNRYTPSQRVGKGDSAMNFVAYYRVSTKAQGKSGLGLDAQKSAVETFSRQSAARVMKEYVEVESGRKTAEDRPELAGALAYAKRAGATLVVAKLDRLARNVAFLSRLMESGVDFVACDNPHANRFTIHVLAAVAEWEREQISARTKAALAQVKARGVALGSARPGHWEGRESARQRGGEKGRAKASKVISAKARAEYADLLPTINAMRASGASLQKIADALNAEGHKTRRGAAFRPAQVQKILRRGK